MSWTKLQCISSRSIRSMIFVNSDMGWIISSNSIIKYKNGVNSISLETQLTLSDCMLYNNYPNPFNATTTIQYEIMEPSHIKLSVYNLNGQFIECLVSKNQAAGKYQVNWTASNYCSGIYLYQITTDHNIKTKKMIFLK